MLADTPAFVAAVETGGFAAASRHLGLSRSAIGKAVGRLEARLGVRLFQRTTRSQALTEEGRLFYERCRTALDELRTGAAMLASGQKVPHGKLRISMPVLFGRQQVTPLLMHLAVRHPDLAFDLSFNDRHVDLIEDGFDLAIRNGPLRDAANLMSRRIARQWTMLYAAPAYVAQHGAPTTQQDLMRHRAVVYARSGRLHPWRFPQPDGSIAECTPQSRLRFDDLGAVADAAIAGLGLAWLPDWIALHPSDTGALVRVAPLLPSLMTDIHAVWPSSPYLPTKVRITIDALVVGLGRAGTAPDGATARPAGDDGDIGLAAMPQARVEGAG